LSLRNLDDKLKRIEHFAAPTFVPSLNVNLPTLDDKLKRIEHSRLQPSLTGLNVESTDPCRQAEAYRTFAVPTFVDSLNVESIHP
jgi:hypothetical protein